MATVESIRCNIRDWNVYNDYLEVYFHEGDFILEVDKADFDKDEIDVDDIAEVIFAKYQ